jgi:hypothetical protein
MWDRRRNRPPRPEPTPQVTDGALAAREARERSKYGLLSAIESGIEARRLAERVRDHGRRNGFAELLEQSMRRREAES